MRNLTINRNKLSNSNYIIRYTVNKNQELSTKDKTVFTFITDEPHEFTPPYKILLVKSFGGDESSGLTSREMHNQYTHTTQKEVFVDVVDSRTFNITFNNYELANVTNLAYSYNNALLETLDKPFYEYVNDEKRIIVRSMNVEYQGVGIEDNGHELITFQTPINNLDGDGLVFIKNTWHLKTIETQIGDDDEFDDINIQIYNGSEEHFTSAIQMSNSIDYKTVDENQLIQQLMSEITSSITPQIVDNEKRQFLPAIAQGSSLKIAQAIEFNLHFRNRYDLDVKDGDKKQLSKTWSTTDEQIWNGYSIKSEGGLKHDKNFANPDEYADELCDIGFTEDDIRFRKTKLKKSFLRLMFYSSNNPLDRELLYYSTIFFNTGELYQKYANIKNKIDDNGYVLHAFDDTRTDESLRLSAKFTIKNKYNTDNSSEGFYLYLFPNELKEENVVRTIYMKVEFNHAGYGKTVAMMVPRRRTKTNYTVDGVTKTKITYNIHNTPLLHSDKDFPLTFMKTEDGMVDNDFERYSDSIMIPVNIIYSKDKKEYLYYFPWYNKASQNKITINLWEPRMRG